MVYNILAEKNPLFLFAVDWLCVQNGFLLMLFFFIKPSQHPSNVYTHNCNRLTSMCFSIQRGSKWLFLFADDLSLFFANNFDFNIFF